MVEEAEVQDTTKLFEVISVTDSEVSNTGGGMFVSPSDFSTGEVQGYNVQCEHFLLWFVALRKCRRSSLLTRTVGCGEIKTRDLAASVAQDADQLPLVGGAWTQPTDGVGVKVPGDGGFLPRRMAIFLKSENEFLVKI